MSSYALRLVKTENFHDVRFKLFTDGEDIWVMQYHLGLALEYTDPMHRVTNICKSRWPELFRPHMKIFELAHVEDCQLEKRIRMRFFNSAGMLELCRHSGQRRATELMHWLHKQVTDWRNPPPAEPVVTLPRAANRRQQGLALVRTAEFDGLACDFYGDGKELWLTREQIGRALGYSEPMIAISKIHQRHADRLDKFSVLTKLVNTDGKQYDTYLYSAKGVYEICRWSRQPKADAFFDWVYDILEGLRRGQLALVSADRAKKLAAALQEILTPAEAAKLVEAFTR